MYWMITPLLVLAAWLTVTRVAAVVLVATGMSAEAARFQAWSAFTGTGFTTDEAEATLRHPVRRRVIRWLMFFGHAGLAAFAGTLVVGFTRGRHDSLVTRIVILSVGLLVVYLVSRIPMVDRALERAARWCLVRFTNLPSRLRMSPDVGGLVSLAHGWMIAELIVAADGWLASAPLGDLALGAEGVRVLSVTRLDGGYDPAPGARTRLRAGESIVVHGPEVHLAELARRPANDDGATQHRAAADRFAASRASGDPGG